jgi:protein-tyrosine phosphatase
VSAVLDLREEIEWTKPRVYGLEAVAAIEWRGIPRLSLAIPDGGPPRAEDLDRAWGFLEHETGGEARSKRLVHVHCRAGLERTGAVLVAFVAHRGGISYTTALERVRNAGWWVQPLTGQREAVEQWLASTQ